LTYKINYDLKGYESEVNMTNVEVRSLIARVEDLTTANWDQLMEDETFKNQFVLITKSNKVDLKSVSKRLADYANKKLI
tara:strand:+ start:183 stop:419 length:237 start_codon:yes stop_codon:yes gene_type:complete